MPMKPVVAIVGRPNAGKSTLFNRMTRTKDALVDNMPGVTRDRHYGSVTWNDKEFSVIDTGGFYFSDTDEFSSKTHEQVRYAITDADALIVLFDGTQGISPFDRDMVELLRGVTRPIFYVVNKMETDRRENELYDFYSLGIDSIFSISAEHGHGVGDLLDHVTAVLPDSDMDPGNEPVRVAIVGRPNVGKSSLINSILGEDRVIVSDIPGTTRDSIDTPVEINGKAYLMIDTAGIRRKARVDLKLEKFAVIKALGSLARCDIALIMIDAADGITEQDIRIAGYAFERGCACIFLLNKWDLVERSDQTIRHYREVLDDQAKFLSFAPMMTVSAKTGRHVRKIFEFIDTVFDQYSRRIGTGPLNRILIEATEKNEPPMYRGRRLKFFYATQTGTHPPTFVSFVNFPEGVHFSYQRYLINRIREATDLDKVPIRLFLRKRGEAENRPQPSNSVGKQRKKQQQRRREKR